MSSVQLSRKKPRDFVHMDELVAADEDWPSYFIGRSVWVYADEYRAELPGDRNYCRIIITAGGDQGWYYQRPLQDRDEVLGTLDSLNDPLSVRHLKTLNFTSWNGRDWDSTLAEPACGG